LSEFHELIRDFQKIKPYLTSFYIYGFMSRNDYNQKSKRTYDNEKRRIENYLKDFVVHQYEKNFKKVFISVDTRRILKNPFYNTWKTKSFTNNDIILHFYILDILRERKKLSAKDITDTLVDDYDSLIDLQVVRLKLNEYEKLGIIKKEKDGNVVNYFIADINIFKGKIKPYLDDALCFFSEIFPLGVIGSFVLDLENISNKYFLFKHHFIVHTLEDEMLLTLLDAIHKKAFITIYPNQGALPHTKIIPLKILVSTHTGRRYICIYRPETKRFGTFRLDSIKNVKILKKCENYDYYFERAETQIKNCWGVSFGGKTQRNEKIYFEIYADEKTESFVIERLMREGRGGIVTRINEFTHSYSNIVHDSNEILPWIKTFTGRILKIEGTSREVINKYKRDVLQHANMYKDDID